MEKILVIDDEKETVELVKDFLSSRGYAVVTALDGSEALKQFDGEKPDIVICDIRMPKKDGHAVLKAIREEVDKDLPFIMMSVLDDFKNIKAAHDAEADFYVTKRSELLELSKNIRLLLNLRKNKTR